MSKIEAFAVVDKDGDMNHGTARTWEDAKWWRSYCDEHFATNAPHRIIRLVPESEAGASEESEVERKAWELLPAMIRDSDSDMPWGTVVTLAFDAAEVFISQVSARRASRAASGEQKGGAK